MSDDYPLHDHKTHLSPQDLMTVRQAYRDADRVWATSKQCAQECDLNPKEIGRRWATLEDNGIAERRGGQAPYQWRVKPEHQR